MAFSYKEQTYGSVTLRSSRYFDIDYSTLDYTPLHSTTQLEADKYVSDVGDTFKVTVGVTELDRTASGNSTLWVVEPTSDRVSIDTQHSAFTALNVTNDSLIRLTRVSKKDAPYVDYANAAVLTEQDLDAQAKQSLHIVQESIDTANDALPLATDGKWDANSKIIKNVPTPSADNDAANKSYVDQSTDVPTVASQISPTNNIQTVASQISPTNNIATVAGKANEIQTVADLEDGTTATSAVSTVAGASSSVVHVAGQINPTNNVATVAGQISPTNNIGTVAGVADSIPTVASKDAEIGRLGTTAMTDTSSGHLTVLGTTTVTANLATVAGQVTPTNNISTVATASPNISTITSGSNIANIATVATNINNGTLGTIVTNAESNAIVMGIALG